MKVKQHILQIWKNESIKLVDTLEMKEKIRRGLSGSKLVASVCVIGVMWEGYI